MRTAATTGEKNTLTNGSHRISHNNQKKILLIFRPNGALEKYSIIKDIINMATLKKKNSNNNSNRNNDNNMNNDVN